MTDVGRSSHFVDSRRAAVWSSPERSSSVDGAADYSSSDGLTSLEECQNGLFLERCLDSVRGMIRRSRNGQVMLVIPAAALLELHGDVADGEVVGDLMP